MLDIPTPFVVLRDWQRLQGPVRRILLEAERYPAQFHRATVHLPDGRQKRLETGSSTASHELLLKLCEALLAGEASFDGAECLSAPKWTPRVQPDGRSVSVYPKAEGFHPVSVDACTEFTGRRIPSQSLFIADTQLARATAQAIAENDLTIEPVRVAVASGTPG